LTKTKTNYHNKSLSNLKHAFNKNKNKTKSIKKHQIIPAPKSNKKKYKISLNNIKRGLNIKKTWIHRPYKLHHWTFTWLHLLKACRLWTVIFFLLFFLSFFSFHYLFLSKFVKPFMLSFWTFTPGFFHSVFLHIFPLFFHFAGVIYWILPGFLIDSNIDWSKFSLLIKMREFWTNTNSWNFVLKWFWGVVW
jgi:hypothetical protein